MTSADLSRIRMHAAETVTDRMSRQHLIAIIKRQRAEVLLLGDELERMWKRLEREWSPPREAK